MKERVGKRRVSRIDAGWRAARTIKSDKMMVRVTDTQKDGQIERLDRLKERQIERKTD